MSEDLRQTIYRTLSLRDTDDLLTIWREGDRSQWTKTALEVIEEILRERLGELPPRQMDLAASMDRVPEESIPETSAESPPTPLFYHPHQVLLLEKRLRQVALGSVVLIFLRALLSLPQTQQVIWTFFGQSEMTRALAWMIALGLVGMTAALGSALLYFPIRALGSILRILMEMETAARNR